MTDGYLLATSQTVYDSRCYHQPVAKVSITVTVTCRRQFGILAGGWMIAHAEIICFYCFIFTFININVYQSIVFLEIVKYNLNNYKCIHKEKLSAYSKRNIYNNYGSFPLIE